MQDINVEAADNYAMYTSITRSKGKSIRDKMKKGFPQKRRFYFIYKGNSKRQNALIQIQYFFFWGG